MTDPNVVLIDQLQTEIVYLRGLLADIAWLPDQWRAWLAAQAPAEHAWRKCVKDLEDMFDVDALPDVPVTDPPTLTPITQDYFVLRMNNKQLFAVWVALERYVSMREFFLEHGDIHDKPALEKVQAVHHVLNEYVQDVINKIENMD